MPFRSLEFLLQRPPLAGCPRQGVAAAAGGKGVLTKTSLCPAGRLAWVCFTSPQWWAHAKRIGGWAAASGPAGQPGQRAGDRRALPPRRGLAQAGWAASLLRGRCGREAGRHAASWHAGHAGHAAARGVGEELAHLFKHAQDLRRGGAGGRDTADGSVRQQGHSATRHGAPQAAAPPRCAQGWPQPGVQPKAHTSKQAAKGVPQLPNKQHKGHSFQTSNKQTSTQSPPRGRSGS